MASLMKLFMKYKCNIYILLLSLPLLQLPAPAAGTLLATSIDSSKNKSNNNDNNNNNRSNYSYKMNTECKHPTDMWGDPNPNIFYVCNAADQTPLQLHCPEGRGFFDGLGFKGCLPYAHWPACRPTAAQAAALLEVGCDSPNRSPSSSADNDGVDDDDAHLQQPWATLDPNKFYMCPGIAATPLLLNCAGGKGFVQTSDIVGCADWLLWRQHMQCEKYY